MHGPRSKLAERMSWRPGAGRAWDCPFCRGRPLRSRRRCGHSRICARPGRSCAGHSNVTLREFHAEDLPFPDESFDLVLLFEAIYYVRDVRRFLEETHTASCGRKERC